MKDIPILMSDPMIRAYQAGLKTQTRRVIKPQPADWVDAITYSPYQGVWMFHGYEGGMRTSTTSFPGQKELKCPYGRPGDRLWFKEAWRVGAWSDDGRISIDYRADGYSRREWLDCPEDRFERLYEQSMQDAVKAGYDPRKERVTWEPGESPCRWRPSIFMPRKFARFTPKILDIRAERLQDISEHDAINEGIEGATDPDSGNTFWRGNKDYQPSPIDAFMDLWDSINAKPKPVYVDKKIVEYVSYPFEDIREIRKHRGKPWHVVGNPFLWILEFERYRISNENFQ